MARVAAVIGDIHGEAALLATLLDKVRAQYGSEVEFYHLGDMIDRGPDSKAVVQLCLDNGIQGIMGNHETWLHQYLATGQFDSFALNKSMAGDATLRSYGISMPSDAGEIERRLKSLMPAAHRDYILGLPLWRKIVLPEGVFRLSHTGFKVTDAALNLVRAHLNAPAFGGNVCDSLCDQISRNRALSMLWTNPTLKESVNLYEFTDGSCQIFGHVPVRAPIITKNWIAADTGSGTRPPYALTAVVLPLRETVKVTALTTKIQAGKINDFSM